VDISGPPGTYVYKVIARGAGVAAFDELSAGNLGFTATVYPSAKSLKSKYVYSKPTINGRLFCLGYTILIFVDTTPICRIGVISLTLSIVNVIFVTGL
jgi:hypothetical protein